MSHQHLDMLDLREHFFKIVDIYGTRHVLLFFVVSDVSENKMIRALDKTMQCSYITV